MVVVLLFAFVLVCFLLKAKMYASYSCEIEDFVESPSLQAVWDNSDRDWYEVCVCPHEGYRSATPLSAS